MPSVLISNLPIFVKKEISFLFLIIIDLFICFLFKRFLKFLISFNYQMCRHKKDS